MEKTRTTPKPTDVQLDTIGDVLDRAAARPEVREAIIREAERSK